MQVRLTDDPVRVLSAAGAFLASRPVDHNLVLSLLQARVDHPEPGRYGWVAGSGPGGDGFSGIGGVIFQSPFERPATITPLASAAAAVALAEAVARAWSDLPGLAGEAASAAAFAAAHASARGAPAWPVEAQRLYRLAALVPPAAPVPGAARRAVRADQSLVAGFLAGFRADVGEDHGGPVADREQAARLIAAGRLWLWDEGSGGADGVRAMAQGSLAHAGVARVGPVYTAPPYRGRGYGGACTAAVSQRILDEGATPILYAQLDNPTSNALYQRLGYEPVAEVLRYRFG